MGDVQEAIHLNRLVRLHPLGAEGGERWEIEADSRHVEILVSQMGLNNESKAVSTPGVRMTDSFISFFLIFFFSFFLSFFFLSFFLSFF